MWEACAGGSRVVSTTLGAEGLEATSGTHLLVADSPAEFAQATLELLEQPEKASAVALQARRLAENSYDWSVVVQKLDQVYRQLVAERRAG